MQLLLSFSSPCKQGKQQVKKQSTKKKQARKTDNPFKDITIPYIRGVREPVQQAMKKHNIRTIVKPHTKLRQLLVYTKDRIHPDNKCNVIYEIPCKTVINHTFGRLGELLLQVKRTPKGM